MKNKSTRAPIASDMVSRGGQQLHITQLHGEAGCMERPIHGVQRRLEIKQVRTQCLGEGEMKPNLAGHSTQQTQSVHPPSSQASTCGSDAAGRKLTQSYNQPKDRSRWSLMDIHGNHVMHQSKKQPTQLSTNPATNQLKEKGTGPASRGPFQPGILAGGGTHTCRACCSLVISAPPSPGVPCRNRPVLQVV
eukprot:scaffold270797_cov18-Tisochrysis_lutea.AAC.1